MSGWGKARILQDKLTNISELLKIYYQIHWFKDGKVERDVLLKFLKENYSFHETKISEQFPVLIVNCFITVMGSF